MPPRLNKRQQRELEELEALKASEAANLNSHINIASGDEKEDDDEPGPSNRLGGRGGVFMNFLPAEESEEEEEKGQGQGKSAKSKKSKKKKKKTAAPAALTEPKPDPASPSPSPAPASAPAPPPATAASAEPPKDKETPKPSRTSTPLPPGIKSEKKAQKKARQKEKKAGHDEIDKALAELSLQYPSSQNPSTTHTTSHQTSSYPALSSLLAVSLPHLDSDAEMRRFFGSRVVLATRASEGSSSSSSASAAAARNRKLQQGGKSHLTRPQLTWWPAKAREGLSLRALSEEEVGEMRGRHGWVGEEVGVGKEKGKEKEKEKEKERWWTVEYSRKYLGVTKAFMGAVLSGDPQGLYDLLSVLPYHADTLLQISEIYRHREEHAQAVDFIDRALFTYERAFMGAFSFTTGLNRLDFDRVENRPFFLAVHRQVADLQRRGCIRTAFEFARLMYALDPWTDPHGAVLHLEFVAIKAGMGEWLLDVWGVFEERWVAGGGGGGGDGGDDGKLNPALLPGWMYARALAMRVAEEARKDEDHTASTEALKEAARDFPSVVPLLADKLDVAIPAHVRSHKDFRIMTDAYSLTPQEGILHLLSHLYAHRSSPLWKEKDRAAWFARTITATFSAPLPASLPTTGRKKAFMNQYATNVNLRYAVYRHVMVLEASGGLRRLMGFVPRELEVGDVKSLSCDPLPPPTALTAYDDDTFFAPLSSSSGDAYDPRTRTRTRTRRQQALDERRLAQLIPDAHFRAQLRGLFDAHPELAGRFPGGVVGFAQAVAQMRPEVVEDLMAGVAAAGGGLGGLGGAGGEGWGGEGWVGEGGQGGGAGMPGAFGDEDGGLFGFGGAIEVDLGNGDVVGLGPAPGGPPILGAPMVDVQMDVGVDVGDEGEGEGGGEGGGEGEGSEGEEEEEEEEEEDISPMPRVLRNIIGRFFGRNVQVRRGGESSSSDEDEDEEGDADRDGGADADGGAGVGGRHPVVRDDLGVD